MIVVLLLVIAAVAFGVGWGTEEELYVQIALAASVVAGLVVLWRILGTPTSAASAEAGVADEAESDEAESDEAGPGGAEPTSDGHDLAADEPAVAIVVPDESDAPEAETADSIVPSDGSIVLTDGSRGSDEVVFLPRRATFHAADCSAVAGRAVARGSRVDLEATGMTACRRCLSDPSA